MRQLLIVGFFTFLAFASQAQTVSQIGYSKRGKASYFADNRGGIFTASGERYDMGEYVAAHPYIEFNSYVKVTNLDNGYSVVVRINDRMDAQDRIIDLSKAAADKIGATGQLVVDVKIEIVRNPAMPVTSTSPRYDEYKFTPTPTVIEEPVRRTIITDPNAPIYHTVQKGENLSVISSAYNVGLSKLLEINKMKLSDVLSPGQVITIREPALPPAPKEQTRVSQVSTARTTATPQTLEEQFGKLGTYTLDGAPVKPAGYGAQVGWYSDIAKAIELGKRFEGLQFGNIYIQSGWEKGKRAYRVILGAYPNKEDTKGMIDFLNERQYHAFPKEHY